MHTEHCTTHHNMYMTGVDDIEHDIVIVCSNCCSQTDIGTLVPMATLDKYFTAKEGEWQKRRREKERNK